MTDWLAELDGHRVVVDVPASSANLGAGYDCLAVALGLSNVVQVEVCRWNRGLIDLVVEGEGAGELPASHENRFVVGLESALRAARGALPEELGWRIRMRNEIPLSRGLGSSAAATVGGLVAGNALVGDSLTIRDLLRLATEIEGHPDNAAAALLGGFVAAASIDGGFEAIQLPAPRDLRAVLFIPELRLSTSDMRAVLPLQVPLADAVANLSRVAVGVAAMATGRFDLLATLTVDRLHEPYRSAHYPQLPRLVAAVREAGALGACLSGAGSTILAFADTETGIARVEAAFRAAAADVGLPGRVVVVPPRGTGARVVSSA